MARSVSSTKFTIRRRFRLLWLLAQANWQQEVAYFANRVLGLLTPFLYGISFIVFMVVLYQNITSIAGYSRDEMLFLIFIGQLLFYLYSFWGQGSEHMETSVNTGQFDYFLILPIPSLFYTTFCRIRPLHGLVNLLGPLTPTWLIINWSNVDLVAANLPFAGISLLAGIILFHQFQFITSLICFWTGRGQQANLMVYAASSQSIPLEGFSAGFRWLFLGIVPVFFTSVVASVALGKANPVFWSLISLVVLVIFSSIKRILWHQALKQYASASS